MRRCLFLLPLLFFLLGACGGVSPQEQIAILGHGVTQTGFPAVPASAETFSNLENTAGWTQCDSSGCSGSVGTGTYSLSQGSSCPLGSSCMEITASPTGNGEYNVLSYLNVGCGSLTGGCTFTGTQHFILDEYIYFVAGSALQGIEIDPDDFDGTVAYEPSIQCSSTTNTWRVWNEGATSHGWNDTGYSCATFLSGTSTAHHIQLYGDWNRTAGSYTFITLYIDGSPVFQNQSITWFPGSFAGTAKFNVQCQLDLKGTTTGAVNEYFYHINFSHWAG